MPIKTLFDRNRRGENIITTSTSNSNFQIKKKNNPPKNQQLGKFS